MKEQEKEGVLVTILIVMFLLTILCISSQPISVYKIKSVDEVEMDRFYDSLSHISNDKNDLDISKLKRKEIRGEKKKINNLLSKKFKSNRELTLTVTTYNPERCQTDSDPLITADNSKIHLGKLNSGRLKWIAVSRDLLEKGLLDFGDRVIIDSEISEINGIYEVHDLMNSRFKNRIDILRSKKESTGKWEDIKVKVISPRN